MASPTFSSILNTATVSTPQGSVTSPQQAQTSTTPLLSTPLVMNTTIFPTGNTTTALYEEEPSSQECIRNIDDDWLIVMFPFAVRFISRDILV